MTFLPLKQTFKAATIAAITILAGSTINVQDASASSYGYGYGNANTINRIINQISPRGWSYKGGHSYGRSYGSHGYKSSYRTSHQPYYGGYNSHSYGSHTYSPDDYGYSYDTATPYTYVSNSYYDLDSSIYNRSMDLGVFFAPSSSHITLRGKEVLDSLGYALASTTFAHSVYRIAGHTDTVGNARANRKLSKKRAYAVKKYLQHRFHINPRRLIAVGFGEDRLKDHANPTSAINRRVEVTLIATSYKDLSGGSY
ncbi:MAG: OmpA family protein [Hyphomicrobiaceae bacterium]|nr:OmpA family protein [Hyphomicrobiaceae bacterium]